MNAAGPEFVPTWLGVFLGAGLLLALGLGFIAALLIGTVVIAGNKQIVPWNGIKTALFTLAWIVPAAGVVVGVAWIHHARTQATVRQVKMKEMDKQAAVQAAEMQAKAEQRQIAVAKPEQRQTVLTTAFPGPETQALPADSASSEAAEPRPMDNSRLRTRITSTDAPAWAEKPDTSAGDTQLVNLSSQRFATLEEAETQVTSLAADRIAEYFHREYPAQSDWKPTAADIDAHAVRYVVGEVMDKDFGNGFKSKMYRAHVQLELSPQVRNAFYSGYRNDIVWHRVGMLGGALGLMTLALGTVAGYFRLDDLTGGKYRRRLQVAATSLIAAGGLAVAQVIRFVG